MNSSGNRLRLSLVVVAVVASLVAPTCEAQIQAVTPRGYLFLPKVAPCLAESVAGLKVGRPFTLSGLDILWESTSPANGARVVAFRPRANAEGGVEYKAVIEPTAGNVVMLQVSIWLASEEAIAEQANALARLFAEAGFPSDVSGTYTRHEASQSQIVSIQAGARGVVLSCNSSSFAWLQGK